MKPESRKKRLVGVSLSTELLERIDRDRGLIPRSRYIEHLLKKVLQPAT